MKMNDDDMSSSKMEVLKELRQMAMELMGNKLKPSLGDDMKQVTVAADSEEGLEEGLAMAKEMAPEMASMSESEEDEDMDLDEIEEMIRELEEKRKMKLMKA